MRILDLRLPESREITRDEIFAAVAEQTFVKSLVGLTVILEHTGSLFAPPDGLRFVRGVRLITLCRHSHPVYGVPVRGEHDYAYLAEDAA